MTIQSYGEMFPGRMFMKRYLTALPVIVLLLAAGVDASCATDVSELLNGALKTLGAQKGDQDLCALTNATYVEVAGKTTERYVDVIQDVTGCSVGRGNLLFYHRPADYPLVIALFDRRNQSCIVIRYDGKKGWTGKLKLDNERIYTAEFWEEARGGVAGPDAYSILGILGSWSMGAPHDFLKCTDFHGHACPGLAFGYFVAKTIEKKYPLDVGEKYVFIASPVACKDDAIQTLLDLTPGKSGLFVKDLTEDEEGELQETKTAGILVRWKEWDKQGRGVVFGLDMNRISQVTGFKKPSGKAEPRIVFKFIPHLHKWEEFVTVLREFPVTPELMQGLKGAGHNPYELIGMTKTKKPAGGVK